jgi:hypothetical protein
MDQEQPLKTTASCGGQNTGASWLKYEQPMLKSVLSLPVLTPAYGVFVKRFRLPSAPHAGMQPQLSAAAALRAPHAYSHLQDLTRYEAVPVRRRV